jgi:hypothetical protein
VLLLLGANVSDSIYSLTSDLTAGIITQVVSATFYTVLVVTAQLGLNKAWRYKYTDPQNAGLSWVEFVLTLFGLLVWVGAFIRE